MLFVFLCVTALGKILFVISSVYAIGSNLIQISFNFQAFQIIVPAQYIQYRTFKAFSVRAHTF